jgi:recombination protein RecR
MSLEYQGKLAELIDELSRLPGIGRRSAQRLALYLVRQPMERVQELADKLMESCSQVHPCPQCGNLTEDEYCDVCADPSRDRSIICVVEDAVTVISIERSGEFSGLYHVLGGIISPLDGMGPEDLTIDELMKRAAGAKEIVIAVNPSVEGDATTLYISKLLKPTGVKVTRLASGIPVGGDLQYADSVTLARALAGRTEV